MLREIINRAVKRVQENKQRQFTCSGKCIKVRQMSSTGDAGLYYIKQQKITSLKNSKPHV